MTELQNKVRDLLPRIDHRHVLATGIGLLLLCYIAIYLVDIRNIFGLRSLFQDFTVPVLWDFLFTERGLVEIVQWTFLGSLAITSAYIAGLLRDEDGFFLQKRFWSLFAVAGVLMLIEDAGNVRHFLLRWHIALDHNVVNTLETIYFIFLAAVPTYATLRYGKNILEENRRTFLLLIFGFLFYGTAVFLSGPADLTTVNQSIGGFLYDSTVSMGGDELRELYEQGDQNIRELEEQRGVSMMDVRYRMKDFLVEESLELLGATFLLASAFSYLENLRRREEVEETSLKDMVSPGN